MKPYFDDGLVTLYQGDCLAVLRTLPDDSVDSVVTDPPYGLSNTDPKHVAETLTKWVTGDHEYTPPAKGGFMGKTWDSFVPPPAVWIECMRVLKPGGHLLVFAGTRTQDLMGLSIRLAGFDIRDSIGWIYGCLSEDSEALTRRGWVRGPELRDDDEVMQWDHTTGRLSWTTPQRIIVKPWQGRMVRLANRHTDQMLTPDHRVYAQVRRHSRNPKPTGHEVVQAGELRPSWQVSLPMAGILDGGTDVDPDFAYLVGWWLTDAWLHGDGKAAMFSQAKPETLGRLRAALAPYEPSEYVGKPRLEQHSAEHTFYVTGDLADRLIAGWPNRELRWDVLDWSLAARRRLVDGLVDGDGSRKPGQHGVSFWSQNPERLDIVLALFLSVGWRAFADKVKGAVHANPRPSTQVQKSHRDAAPDVAYDGLVWCVTVPSGAFVARRNDRPFITGNSGFPKSMDVSKAIDKAAGSEREVVGTIPDRWTQKGSTYNMSTDRPQESVAVLGAPATPEAEKWTGWGTALKPAIEPVIVARKPIKGTVAANVLAHGTGGINIDASRVGTGEDKGIWPKTGRADERNSMAGPMGQAATDLTVGRFPPNVLLDPEAAKAMDEQSGRTSGTKPSRNVAYGAHKQNGVNDVYGAGLNSSTPNGKPYPDSGGASRFFPVFKYQAKAPKKERPVIEREDGTKVAHPTVKPLALMEWLVTLVTPPGGVVLDPFVGSGTTLQAARDKGFRAIGIEADADYVELIRERLAIDASEGVSIV